MSPCGPLHAASIGSSLLQIPTAWIICPYSDPIFGAVWIDFKHSASLFSHVNTFTNHRKIILGLHMPPGALGTGATRLDQNQSAGSWVSLCLSLVSHLHVFSTMLIAPKSLSCVPLLLLSSPDSPKELKVWGTKKCLAGEGW